MTCREAPSCSLRAQLAGTRAIPPFMQTVRYKGLKASRESCRGYHLVIEMTWGELTEFSKISGRGEKEAYRIWAFGHGGSP